MKSIYILIMLVVAVLVLGCIGNKQAETSTQAPNSPAQTSVSPASQDSGTSGSVASAPIATGTNSENDTFGTESDIASMDSLASDSNMDVSLSDSI
jgi:hypothetical protein